MTLRKLCLAMLLTFMLTTGTLAWAASAEPLLVLDARNLPALPKHFRTALYPLPDNVNAEGLSDLYIAGGAQFSKLALQKILHRLGTKRLTIIDLREESHGFLNGNAVSWYGYRDAANANKTPLQIEEDQSRLLADLGQQVNAVVYPILDKTPKGRIAKTQSVEFLVHGVSSEADLVNNARLKYYRIYVQDFHAPSDKQVDRFIQIVKQIPANQWIYFHCRAGIGRTTTFMAMYDMMHNAKKISLANILTRQAALGGKDLSELPPPDNFKYKSAKERLEFLKQFYQYAQENDDDFKTSWTSWRKL